MEIEKDAESIIGSKVVGQNEAINTVLQCLREPRSGSRPLGIFIFLGPAGVGKSELAKVLAEYIYHSPQALVRIDVEAASGLAAALGRQKKAVLLFEEIEKADPEVLNALEQAFSRLSDSLIIMTSNIGSQTILEANGQITPAVRKKILDLFSHSFRPEFIEQVDEIIMFHSLTLDNLRAFVDLQLAEFSTRFAEKNIKFKISPRATDYLTQKGYDLAQGARPLRRILQIELFDEFARQITAGKIKARQTVQIAVQGDQIIFK